jgi:hypothetical protein
VVQVIVRRALEPSNVGVDSIARVILLALPLSQPPAQRRFTTDTACYLRLF